MPSAKSMASLKIKGNYYTELNLSLPSLIYIKNIENTNVFIF